MIPTHNTTKWVGRPPKPPLWLDPLVCPTLTPFKEPTCSCYPLGGEQGNLLLVFAPSCPTSPNKALPEFLIWPHKFLLIKEFNNPGWYQ